MESKKTFVMYNEWASAFRKMDNEQAGKMIKAIYDYQNNETELDIDDPGLVFLFEVFKDKFDRDREKYFEECRKNRENGMKGGRPKKTTETQPNPKNPMGFSKTPKTQPNPKNLDSDSDSDSDSDKKIEKENIKRKSFVPPTLDEVENYCRERNSSVNPKQFFDYFNTGDWVDSKGNKVKNWKQKIITWEKFNQGHSENRSSNVTPFDANAYILSKINGGEA